MVELDINCIYLSRCGRGTDLMSKFCKDNSEYAVKHNRYYLFKTAHIDGLLCNDIEHPDLPFILNSATHRFQYIMIVNDL